jgi:hypothetical protein
LFLIVTNAFSQSTSINYKALIKDGSGNVVVSENITIQFIILEGATNVYQETHTPTTDANGIAIVNIGEGSVDSGNYNAIDWSSDDHYLNVQINTGSGLTDIGTTQFMAVPYALSAANAASKIDELTDGKSNAEGSSLFLGVDAGLNDNGNHQNLALGYEALYFNIEGSSNTAIGFQSLWRNEGSKNTAVGNGTLTQNTTGNYNTAAGTYALHENNSGNNNTAIGYRASFNNSTGENNTGSGYKALDRNTSGSFNTANGSEALNKNTTGFGNTANGYQALYLNETGFNNMANGYKALMDNTSGDSNTANGFNALQRNTSGHENTANGGQALFANETGFRNTANGINALFRNTTGDNNTAIGYSAGSDNTSGSNNVFIGIDAGSSINAELNYKLYIANGSTTNPLIYGEFDTNLVRINGVLDVTEEIHTTATGNANMVPIAYGSVSSTGSILGGTGNFTVTYNAGTTSYTIFVNNTPLTAANSSGVVSVNTSTFRTANTTYDGTNMLVHIFLSNGDKVQSPFQFIIYKL